MNSFWFQQNYPKAAARIGRTVIIIIIISIAAGFVLDLLSRKKPFEIKLTSITGTLKQVEFREKYKHQSDPCISFTLLEYPEYNFQYYSAGCKAFSISFFSKEIGLGDSLTVTINKNELDSFYQTLTLYEVKSKHRVYLSDDSIKDEKDVDNQFLKFTLIFAGILFGLYLLFEFTGLSNRIGRWYSNLQYSETKFNENPPPGPFNELQD